MSEFPHVPDLPIRKRSSLSWLRVAMSLILGLLLVAAIALWVRSYWWFDTAQWSGARTTVFLTLFRGRAGFTWVTFTAPHSAFAQSHSFQSHRITAGTSVNYNDGTGRPLPSYLGFQSSWLSAPVRRPAASLVIPFWFISLIAIILTATPWLRAFRWRFSVRTLLIATTLISVVLGLVVWVIG